MGGRELARRFDARCVARALAAATGEDEEALLDELALWAEMIGGSVRLVPREPSAALRPGRRVAPDPGPPDLVLFVPRDWLDGGAATS